MKKARILLVLALVAVALTWGALALAGKPGGGGGGGTGNCKIVSCPQCPEGMVLQQPQVWPNCCVCVPG